MTSAKRFVGGLIMTLGVASAAAREIVLQERLKQQWTNELVTVAFEAGEGQCHRDSIRLTGPRGPVPVQVSDPTFWPGSKTFVRTAKLSFIVDLAPLARDVYTVSYDTRPDETEQPPTDLTTTRAEGSVEFATSQFAVRLLAGTKQYGTPINSTEAPGPVVGMRLGVRPSAAQADGTWFGGSRMTGPSKISAWSAEVTDNGPLFARAMIRYTYAHGNTMDLTVQVVAGDNTMRMETLVANDQPRDGFDLVLSRNLPPLLFQVQDERRKDRPCFMDTPKGTQPLKWAEIPLTDYVVPDEMTWCPVGNLPGLVTSLTPWEDWFGTFTQTRIRLKLEGTKRELQLRSLDAGAWVEPREIEAVFDPSLDADPRRGIWVGWNAKCMPILRGESGEVYAQVNAAQGVRKWTVSDCLSVPGAAALYNHHGYEPESTFPPETRPLVGRELNKVKDYVLDWEGDAGKHPRLYVSRADLESLWERGDADPEVLEPLLKRGTARSVDRLAYMPNTSYSCALGAYLLTGSSEIAEQTLLLARTHKTLTYDIWGIQFGSAGKAPTLYDGIVDSPAIPDEERPLLRARMAYFAYRLMEARVWSAERGYCSGNANMTVTWEIPRGIVACTIAEHPMARTWYRKAERIMELFLDRMVGPAGEWPEAMSHHGRTSINMLLAFAVASTNSGLHDYMNDPRMKRLILYWAKLTMPRDPRTRGHYQLTAPDIRHFPSMGRDSLSVPGGTTGVMARMTRATDPEYSAHLQWSWLEEGANTRLSHMGGFAYVACDKHVPARVPDWPSEVFPRAGAVLRHGLGTANEHQVILYSGDHSHAFYPGHTGGVASIFAYGTPVAGLFPGGYEYQEGYLTNHVDLARSLESVPERTARNGYVGTPTGAHMWSWQAGQTARFGERGGLANVSAFSTLPRQDYAAIDVARHHPRGGRGNWKTDLPQWPVVAKQGKPPVDVRRQTLFLKDNDPAEPAYLLIRDTVKGPQGGQPTMWQMWTVSDTVDVPAKAQAAAALAKEQRHKILPARRLKGDRFTAIGQLGTDVEYYIASPADGESTPRHTLRWGTNMFDWANKLGTLEYQDLLHLQMPDNGVYYVAFFPRKQAAPVPTFSTLGHGMIIKVSGDFGVDYGFLSALDATASGEGASFRGTAASVQDRNNERVLSLGAAGEVSYGEHGLAANFPAALWVDERKLTVRFPAGIQPPAFELMKPFPGGTVKVITPGKWALPEPAPGVELAVTEGGLSLKVPAGHRMVTVVRQD